MSVVTKLSKNRSRIFLGHLIKPVVGNAFENFMFNRKMDNPMMFLRQSVPTVIIGCNQNPHIHLNLDKMRYDGVDIMRSSRGGKSSYIDRGCLSIAFVGAEGVNRYSISRNFMVIIEALKAMSVISPVISTVYNIVIGDKHIGSTTFKNRTEDGQLYRLQRVLIHMGTDFNALSRYLSLGVNDVNQYSNFKEYHEPMIETLKTNLINKFRIAYPAQYVDKIEVADQDLSKGVRHGMSHGVFQRSLYMDAPEKIVNRKDVKVIDVTDDKLLEIPEVRHIYNIRSSDTWLYGKSKPLDKLCGRVISRQFDWGQMHLYYRVKEGVISEVECYTDSTIIDIPDIIKGILLGQSANVNRIMDSFDEVLRYEIVHDSSAICMIDDVKQWLSQSFLY